MKRLNVIILVMFLACFQAFADGIHASLAKLDNVVSVEPMESTEFAEKYLLRFQQPVDYNDPSQGYFTQRVFVSHVHPDSATVVVTEGYYAHYAAKPSYREEISQLLNTNLVVVEHRYFAESVPENLDWDKMNAVFAAHDHHNIVSTLKNIYKGKWIADGISKGGQTSLMYRAFYPEDVDITVPYVAPLCKAREDGRHEPFIANYVGTPAQRDSIQTFQIEFLKRKSSILPMLDSLAKADHIEYALPLEEIYDYITMEYSFALWQWGTPVSTIPSLDASDKVLFDYMMKISSPTYFTNNGPTAPFFVQAAKELGYYGYDTKPFKKYLSIRSSKDYMAKMMLPDGYRPDFDNYIYKMCSKFLKKTDAKILCIYGQYDPWTAVRIPDSKKENIKIYIDPKGSHRSRISTFPEETRDEILSILKDWLYN